MSNSQFNPVQYQRMKRRHQRNRRQITPSMDMIQYAMQQYSSNRPRLNWDSQSGYAVKHISMGGSRVNIVYNQSLRHNRLQFAIEYPIGFIYSCYSKWSKTEDSTLVGLGFEFYIDENTKKVNLHLRQKKMRGVDRVVEYRDCRYFGMDTETRETIDRAGFVIREKKSKFTVSNEWQDKTIDCWLNMEEFPNFDLIVGHINDFIQFNLYKNTQTEEVMQHAFPLLVPVRVGFVNINRLYQDNPSVSSQIDQLHRVPQTINYNLNLSQNVIIADAHNVSSVETIVEAFVDPTP
jgi:hypothetical protein